MKIIKFVTEECEQSFFFFFYNSCWERIKLTEIRFGRRTLKREHCPGKLGCDQAGNVIPTRFQTDGEEDT